MSIRIYGIPSCGTVRKARQWLDGRGIKYEWVDFRETSLEPERLARWVEVFGFKPMRNTSGGAYRAIGEEKKTWGDAEWLAAFERDAMLLKRPVVEVDGEPVLVGFKEADWAARLG